MTASDRSVARTHDGRLVLPSPEEVAALPPDGGDEYNRLIFSHSPYLLQHARNPVDWHEWGEEAFALARRRDVPIFLSVGYSTCHWCHVMERESFEDEDVARLLNAAFVCVKVDREERPDVDQVYMSVVQAMTGHGGWPMTVVLTPRLEPIFAATYLPRDSGHGRLGLLDLVPRLEDAWRDKRTAIEGSAHAMVERLAAAEERLGPRPVDAGLVGEGVRQLLGLHDHEHGGFGEAPKFPVPHNLRLLLWWGVERGDQVALDAVRQTLRAMRRGGVFDHVGLGFHRYSTDERWFLPHFEKMLYDQALLCMAYTEAWQALGEPEFRRTAREVCDYVLRDLVTDEGGFRSAVDADSEGQEGLFYVWRPEELVEVLGERDGARVAALFGVEPGGNFHDEATGSRTGASVPYLAEDLPPEVERDDWPRWRRALFEARERRVHPLVDDKVLTDWNGLAIAALAKAGAAFAEADLVDAARRAASFALEHLVDPATGRARKSWREGRAGHDGLLEDHAFLAWGLVELFRATGEPPWLAAARRLVDVALERFWDPRGKGFTTAPPDAADLVLRPKDVYDGALPSGNSVMAWVLLQLARSCGEARYEERAHELLEGLAGRVARFPAGHSQFLLAVLLATGEATELVVAARDGDPLADRALRDLRRAFLPHVVLVERRDGAAGELARCAPFTASMSSSADGPRFHLCRRSTCEAPTDDVEALWSRLRAAVPAAQPPGGRSR